MSEQECKFAREQCPQAREAAETAVKKVFAILGVNVDIPKEVQQFQEDLRFGASMRRAADRGSLALVAVIAAALAATFWSGFLTKITGGH